MRKCVEDFKCAQCGQFVFGDGYRNHCPCCLYSKHVDIIPGDRAADCGGIMTVVDIELEHGALIFTHHCQNCGQTKRNRAHTEDDIEAIIALMSQLHREK